MRSRGVLLLAAVAALALVSGSRAYWTNSGSGVASAGVGRLSAPPQPVLDNPRGTANVEVDWSPGSTLSDSDVPAEGYYVERDDGETTSLACGTSPVSLTTSDSCVDDSVPDGAYTYRVVAVWHSFSETGEASEPVVVDTTPPSGSIEYADGYSTDGSVAVSFSATDSRSSVDTASGQLERASATLSGGGCGSFGSFEDVGPEGVASPYVDSVATDACYRYEYLVADGAGNVATIASANIFKLDTTEPSGGSVSVPPYSNATSVTVTLDAGEDGGSGIDTESAALERATAGYSRLTDECDAFAEYSEIRVAPTSPFLDSDLANGFCYRYRYVISDQAGNQAVYESGVVKVNTDHPEVTEIVSLDPGGEAARGMLADGATLTIAFNAQIDPATVSAECPSTCVITGAEERRTDDGHVFLVIPGVTEPGGADTGSSGYLAGAETAAVTFDVAIAFSDHNSVLTLTVSEVSELSGMPAEGEGELEFTPASSIADLAGNAATGAFKTANSFLLF
jgi:hypothetical protein